MFKNFKDKISRLLTLYRSLPSIFFMFYITLIFIVFMVFSLYEQINKPNCELLICNYQNIAYPILNLIGIILFLPSIIFWSLGLLNIYYLSFSLFLTFIYWNIISYIITWIYHKYKNIPLFDESRISDEFKTEFIISFSYYFIFLIFIFMMIFAIFYYPKTDINMDLKDFITVSSFMIAISTFLINYFKNENYPIKINKGVKGIYLIMLFFTFIGSFISFTTDISIGENTILDDAFLNGFQIGIIQVQMTSILTLFSIYLSYLSYNKKNNAQTTCL